MCKRVCRVFIYARILTINLYDFLASKIEREVHHILDPPTYATIQSTYPQLKFLVFERLLLPSASFSQSHLLRNRLQLGFDSKQYFSIFWIVQDLGLNKEYYT